MLTCLQVELVLKLVQIPTEMLVTRFKTMWPDGTAADLQRVMTVKGLKKSEQQQLLDMLGLELEEDDEGSMGLGHGSMSAAAMEGMSKGVEGTKKAMSKMASMADQSKEAMVRERGKRRNESSEVEFDWPSEDEKRRARA